MQSGDSIHDYINSNSIDYIISSFRQINNEIIHLANLKGTNQDVAIDFHDIPYYGDKDTPGVRGIKPKNGTSWGYSFCSLDIIGDIGYGQLMGHIVLVPYRRKKIFKRDDIKYCAENILRAISKKYRFEIIKMQVMEDHVHLFLSMKPTQNISTVVQCLKGISSKHLREMYPELKTYGDKLWSAGKFFRSVGSVTAETVEYYIKESQGKQKGFTIEPKKEKGDKIPKQH